HCCMIGPGSPPKYTCPSILPMPTGSPSATTTSTVDGSARRITASRTQGDASKRRRHALRSVQITLSPRRPCSTASTSPVDSRSLPTTAILSTLSTWAVATRLETYVAPYRRATVINPARTTRRTRARHPRLTRAGLTCPRRNRRSAETAIGLTRGSLSRESRRPVRRTLPQAAPARSRLSRRQEGSRRRPDGPLEPAHEPPH